MNKEPLVSLIMNCYNGEKYLGEAIHSVYSQTYKNYVFDGDLIHVKRKNISVEKLMVWSDIIQIMIKLFKTL